MNVSNLVRLLEEMATLLELDGANSFKISAYTRAARAISGIGSDLDEYIQNKKLTDIEGVGKGLAEKIYEYAGSGKIGELEELRERIPSGLVAMTEIPGLGPKKARKLYEELEIQSIAGLKKACGDGTIEELKGFGKKTAEKILGGIEQLERYSGRHRIDSAREAALPVLERLRQSDHVIEAEIAGSLRRWKETVHDLDFVVATAKPREVMKLFVEHEDVVEIIAHGETKSSVILAGGIQADIRCVTEKQYPYALLHFTGSKEHNTKLRGRAKEFGLKLNEYGLFPEGKDEALKATSEADIHKHLKLAFIEPEMREDLGEIEAAEKGELPELITREDIRGIPHMHTHYSDGRPDLEDYAQWAHENGIQWMGISDHSQSLKVANGLTPERVKKQHEEIDSVNQRWAKKNVQLLRGIESDILTDGSLDYEDEVLDSFDFVVASIHTNFKLTRSEQTKRTITAMEHPATTILGHMTGRLILGRDGFDIDHKEVIRAAARLGVAIEINANPRRLDMDWRHVREAIDKGCMIAISPDAHVMDGLGDLVYGIAMARKGWLTRENLLNHLTTEQFLKFARSRK